MRRNSHIVAVCGLTAALAIVLMLLGSALGVMTYACPVLVGVLLLCVREELGVKWALTLWAAIGLLAMMLVPELEMTALFLGVFGWYPAAKPALDRLPRWPGWVVKLLALNGASAAVYGLLMAVMGMQDMPDALWGWIYLAVGGNLIFICYDIMLDRLRFTLVPRIRRLFSGR